MSSSAHNASAHASQTLSANPQIVSIEEYEKMNGQIGKDGKNTRRAAKKAEAAREKRFVDRLQHRRERKGGSILSRSDVALHTRPKDVYVIFDGAVFDASNFVNDHPGGPAILMSHAGKDITNAFLDAGHSQLAKFQLADLYVGDLPMIERVNLDDSEEEEEEHAESSGSESEYDEDGIKILKPNKTADALSSKQGKPSDTAADEDRPAPQVSRIVANRYRRKEPQSQAGSSDLPAATKPAVAADTDDDKYGRKPARPQLAAPGVRSNWRLLLNPESVRSHLLLVVSLFLLLLLLSYIRIPWWLLGHDPSGKPGHHTPLEGDVYANDPSAVHDPSLLHANGHGSSHDASHSPSPLEADAAWVQPPREHDPTAVLYF